MKLFSNTSSTSPPAATIQASTPAPTTPTTAVATRSSRTIAQFTSQCYNCQQNGHRVQDYPLKNTSLLVSDVQEDEEIVKKAAGCAFTELIEYPKLHVDSQY